MKNNFEIIKKKRRGLHTLVGAVFFVIVMGSTIGYVTYSMDLVDDLAYQIDAKQDANLNRQDEKFTISEIGLANNAFNLTVQNTGTIPINITKLWAKNTTDSTWNQTSYTINQVVSPGGKIANIGQGTGLVAKDSQSYSLKLLTSRGNSEQVKTIAPGSGALLQNLITIPKTPLSGHSVTVLHTVSNNFTEGTIQNITPIMVTSGPANLVQQGTVQPPSWQGLDPGETVTFEYEYVITGNVGATGVLNATIANAVPGNNVTDSVTIDLAPISQETINEALNVQLGIISMNFTTFELCEPAARNCFSNHAHWGRAWAADINTEYLWRLNVTNNGIYDIILDEKTTLMGLPVKDGGGGNSPKPFFIRQDATPSWEGYPNGEYDPNYQKILYRGNSTVLYFGSQKAGEDALAKTDSNPGIVAVVVTFFGWEDRDATGSKTGQDVEYSQAIPFQAYSIS